MQSVQRRHFIKMQRSYCHHLLICITAFIVTSAEWVEIQQHQLSRTAKPNGIKSLDKTGNSNASQHPFQSATSASLPAPSTPSPKWVEYQFERFGQKPQRNQSAQKLIVSSDQHLKNSAKIVVPATSVRGPSTAAKNRVFQTKTRIDVINDKPESELLNIPQQIETTSRREMPYEDPSTEDTSEYLEEIQIEDGAPAEATATAASGLQIPSIKGFLNFLKSIQSSWLKKTGLDIESKIQLLKNLRDNLMRTIEKQFGALWETDKSEGRHRQRRGLLDESNLNFPPEAALMSINFLTFAVFLIKLVLQVVHIVKSKHYSFSGFNVNAEPITKTSIRN